MRPQQGKGTKPKSTTASEESATPQSSTSAENGTSGAQHPLLDPAKKMKAGLQFSRRDFVQLQGLVGTARAVQLMRAHTPTPHVRRKPRVADGIEETVTMSQNDTKAMSAAPAATLEAKTVAPTTEKTTDKPTVSTDKQETTTPTFAASQNDKKPALGGGSGVDLDSAGGMTDSVGSGSTVELKMPEMQHGFDPAHQARMKGTMGRADEKAAAESDLPSAAEEVGEARGAVVEPQAEADAKAEKDVVKTLDNRPAPSPEIIAICNRIQQAIENKRPPDEDALVETDPKAEAQKVGNEMKGTVSGDADRIQGEYSQMEQKPTGSPQKQAQEIAPTPQPEAKQDTKAEDAAPNEVPQEQMSLDEDVKSNEQQIEEAGMNTPAAQEVKDGPIADARNAQAQLEKTAVEDKAEVDRKQQQAVLNARGDLAALQQQSQQSLETSRNRTVVQNENQQVTMKGSEEQQRQQVSQQAQEIFDTAQSDVNTLLDGLPDKAMALWEAGIETASTAFQRSLQGVKDEIEERHSGIGGAIVGFGDSIFGLPDHIVEKYDQAEKQFGDQVCALLYDISRTVNGIIQDTETIIKNARTDIDNLFNSLPENLKAWATEQQAVFNDRLNGLDQEVQNTRNNFNKQLTERAAQAVQEARQEVHALREAAKGLIGQIQDAIGAFIEDPTKFIIEGLLRLVNIAPASFWAVVNRIQSAIDTIAEDPMKFGNNLMEALKQGFQKFFDNIGTHLMNGLLSWLFQGLNKAGVQAPKDFSLMSIMSFFLDVMGISWQKIMDKIADKLGIGNIGLIEQAWGLISNLMEKGIGGIVELIKDLLNPQEILNQIIQTAIDFVKETLITQVTMRIIGMLNPAGAIVQAIEAIYKVLRWLFEKAAPLFDLIETIVGGIGNIIAGSIGGMATAIEGSLARLLPLVIDFLADLIGLGGLPGKVADAIKGIQSYVEGLIDKALDFIIDKAKALFKKMGFGKQDEDDAKNKQTELDDDPQVAAAKAAISVKGETESDEGEVTEEEAQKIKTDVEKEQKGVSISMRETEDAWEYDVAPIQRTTTVRVLKGGSNFTTVASEPVKFRTSSGLPKVSWSNLITPQKGPGSEAGGTSTPMMKGEELLIYLNNNGQNWVRAHLVNNNLSGEAIPQNLVPATKAKNAEMEHSVEGPAKRIVEARGAVRYKTTVNAYHSAPDSTKTDPDYNPYDEQVAAFPSKITVDWHQLERVKTASGEVIQDKAGGEGDVVPISFEAPYIPTEVGTPRDINTMDIPTLKELIRDTFDEFSIPADGKRIYEIARLVITNGPGNGKDPYVNGEDLTARLQKALEAKRVGENSKRFESYTDIANSATLAISLLIRGRKLRYG